MTAGDTRGVRGVGRHRPAPRTTRTPTDQAWIETLFGHVKGEWPHLETITDPAVLEAELERVRLETTP